MTLAMSTNFQGESERKIFFLRSKIKFILQVHVPILDSNVLYKNTQFVSGYRKKNTEGRGGKTENFFIDAIFFLKFLTYLLKVSIRARP